MQVLIRVSPGYPPLLGRFLRVTHPSAALLISEDTFSHDLHVLSLPPAFNLSHDQTLQFNLSRPVPLPPAETSEENKFKQSLKKTTTDIRVKNTSA